MKKGRSIWIAFRVLGLVAVLVLAFLGPAGANSWNLNGSCYIPDEDSYRLVLATYEECCGPNGYGGYEWAGGSAGGSWYLCH